MKIDQWEIACQWMKDQWEIAKDQWEIACQWMKDLREIVTDLWVIACQWMKDQWEIVKDLWEIACQWTEMDQWMMVCTCMIDIMVTILDLAPDHIHIHPSLAVCSLQTVQL